MGAVTQWENWVIEQHIAPISAKDHHMALYIQFLADGTKSRSAIKETCNSIAWIHSMTGLASPTVLPFVEGYVGKLAKSAGKSNNEEGTSHPSHTGGNG